MRAVGVPSGTGEREDALRPGERRPVALQRVPLNEVEPDPFVVVVVDVAGAGACRVRAVGAHVALEAVDLPLRLPHVQTAALRHGGHRDRRGKRLRVRPRGRFGRRSRRLAVPARSGVEELVAHRPERDGGTVCVGVACRRADDRERRDDRGREREDQPHGLTVVAFTAITMRVCSP